MLHRKSVINKLELYQTKVTNATLKEVLLRSTSVMRDHVRVMLALINPSLNEHLEPTPINEYFRNFYMRIEKEENNNFQDKWISLDGHTTAKNMSNNNYVSALMMQDPYEIGRA